MENKELIRIYNMALTLQQDVDSYLKVYPEDYGLTENIKVNKIEWDNEYNMLKVNYSDIDLYYFDGVPNWFKIKFITFINEQVGQKLLRSLEKRP